MAKDINLLPDITLQEEKQERTRKLLTLISMSILVVGMVGVVIVFAVHMQLTRQYNNIVDANKELESEITSEAKVETLYRDVISRLSAIQTIRNNSKDFEFVLKKLQDLTPEGVSFTDISIAKDNQIAITGTVNSSTNFDTFVQRLIEAQKEDNSVFQDIALASFARNQTENYQFTINMTVKPKQEGK